MSLKMHIGTLEAHSTSQLPLICHYNFSENHEDTHRGDNKDGVDYPGEEGELMESAAFGAVVDESNMKTVRKTVKKKKP